MKIEKRILCMFAVFVMSFTYNPFISYAAASATLCGDATNDKQVDIRDITAVRQHIVQLNTLSEQGFINADIDLNNIVDIKDLTKLQKYIIKVINKLDFNSESTDTNEFYNFSYYYYDLAAASGTKIYESYTQLQNAYMLDETKNKLLEKYNEDFFKNNVLYTSFVKEISSSIPYNLRYVEKTDNEIILNIEKVLSDSHTDDMCTRLICLGVPKSAYNIQKLTINKENIIHTGTKHIQNFDANGLTAFEGVYTTKDFKKITDENAINPSVCRGVKIIDTSQLAEILNDENSELLQKYNADFFKNNQLLIVQYVEGYTDVTYDKMPETYVHDKDGDYAYIPESEGVSCVRDIYIKRQLSENSVYQPEIKFLVYSTWYPDYDIANCIFEK